MDKRTELIETVVQARRTTDDMFSWIHPDSWFERPIPERHRFIFYLGHLEAFDWNLICQNTLEMHSPHEELDRLFAFGIDPPPGKLPQDQISDWPSLEGVHHYNSSVRRTLDVLLDKVPEQVLHVAAEHRLMHAETLSYILHHLDPSRKSVPAVPLHTTGPEPDHQMVPIPEGKVTLGRDDSEGFRWDNECEPHQMHVPGFSISRYKVTNRQFLDFVTEGGPVPHFWKQEGDHWFWHTMSGDIPLPLDWPVYVTLDLAQQYATWKGLSLPSEAQFHRAAYGTLEGHERSFPWGDQPPDSQFGNFNCRGWDPIPVNASPLGDSAFGVAQLVGNGWEWTSTVFNPFGGFQPFPFYPGYSAPFFDSDHYVLKGGSPQTAGPLLRRSFRNWFRGRYPYVYAGFRCVELK